MVIALGIILLAVGLILKTGAVDLPASWDAHVASDTLGWILIVIGVIAIIIGLISILTHRHRTEVYADRGYPPDRDV